MTIYEIKQKISEYAKKHAEADEDWMGFMYESDMVYLISDYCVQKGYLVKGFPKKMEESSKEEYDEDYFTYERYDFYISTLATEKEDVADLMWFYVSKFWKDFFDSKEDFIEAAKYDIRNWNEDDKI